MRQSTLRKLASISALAASCCAGCGGDQPSAPLPPPQKAAASPGAATSTTLPTPAPAAAARLEPFEVSTETPLVAEVIKLFNDAREKGGKPALPLSPELQAVAKAQVQAHVDAQPGLTLSRGRQEKREKSKPMPVADRSAKLGYHFRDLREITVPADGPVAKVLTGYLQDPNNDYHKVALGDWTGIGVAEGRDPKALPHLSLIFGKAESGQGETKAKAAAEKTK